MTHLCNSPAKPLKWEECRVEHFSNGNNGVSLICDPSMDHRRETVAFIDGADLGVTLDMEIDVVTEKAYPIFKMVIDTHNRALSAGRKIGKAEAQNAVRLAIGVR